MHEARLVPRAALPYLEAATGGTQHAALAPLRREALEVLAAGYRSTSRTLLGVLAWALAAGGGAVLAVLPWQRYGALTTVALAVLGAALLGGGLWLGTSVLQAGRRITGAAAAWLRVPVAGAVDTGAGGLLGVVRWRMVLGAGVAGAAVALTVTLAIAVAHLDALGGRAHLGAGPAGAGPASPTVLVAVLAVVVLTTAGVAVLTLGGVRTVLDAAWQRPTVAAVPEHGGPPTVAIDLSSLRDMAAAQHAAPSPVAPVAPVASMAPGAQVEVLLPDGRALEEGTTLVGRRPVARPEDVVDAVVALPDQTVTKTHATVTVDGEGVRVVDRASTNGTLLEASDSSLVRCRPWQVTTVRAPAIIHLGHTRLLVRPAQVRSPLEVA